MKSRILLRLIAYLKTCYQLDVRALAVMRIGVAALVIIDLCIRCCDLEAHYTNAGVLPIDVVKQFGWKPYFWSWHCFNGSFSWALGMFSMHFLLALALLLGFHTRWVTPLVWLLEISLHNRNTFILQSGDDLLRLVLFWGMFLPWGNCYAIKGQISSCQKRHVSVAGIGYMLLIASVYFFTVNLKTSPEWRSDGTAIYYALSLDQIRLPIGDVLYQFPGVMKILTHFVYYLELFIPFLILFPTPKQWPRIVAFLMLVVLHIGIGLTLYIGLFYIINIITAIGFLPASVFDKLRLPYRFLPLKRSVINNWRKQVVFYLSSTVVILSLIVNLGYCGWFSFELKKELWYPIHAFRLDQYWGMFSPNVLKEDGWFVYKGTDASGKEYNLYTQQQGVNFDRKPDRVVSMYSSDRWRKFAENYQGAGRTYLHPYYCNWYLTTWNRNHPEHIMKQLEIYYVEEFSLPDYQTKPLTHRLCSSCTNE
jgi:hypothetical protein